MTEYMQLSAVPRTVKGKQVSQLRRDGWTPAVVYGHHAEPASLSVATPDLERILHAAGTSHLVQIRVDGETEPRMALVREVQRHVTRHTVLHADFIQVRMDERVRSEVPLVLVGEPPLVAHHEAVIDYGITSLYVEALPGDLPAEIEVDVTGLLEMGDVVLARDLQLGDKVTVLSGPDEHIARLMPVSRAVAEVEEAEAPVVEEEPESSAEE